MHKYNFGIAYMDGVGVQNDLEKAEEWLKKGVKGLIREQRSIEIIISFFIFAAVLRRISGKRRPEEV